RCFRVDGDPKSTPVRAMLWSLAERLVGSEEKLIERSISFSPSELNQGLMELGTTVCSPRRPACLACPAMETCGARRAGDPERWPGRSRPQKIDEVEQVCVALLRRNMVLLARRPPYGLWGGLFELPVGEPLPGERPAETAARVARDKV